MKNNNMNSPSKISVLQRMGYSKEYKVQFRPPQNGAYENKENKENEVKETSISKED